MYYSYEQFICAILANYKQTVTVNEVARIMNEYRNSNPDVVIAKDGIRFIGEHIEYNRVYIWLNKKLDELVVFDKRIVPLKNYLNYIGGDTLKEYINNTYGGMVLN